MLSEESETNPFDGGKKMRRGSPAVSNEKADKSDH